MSEDRSIAAAVIGGFMLGGSPRYFVAHFAGGEVDERVRSMFFAVLFVLAGFTFAALGQKFPRFSEMVNASNWGLFCIAVAFGVATAGGSTFLALLPLPLWLHVCAAAALVLVGAYLAIKR